MNNTVRMDVVATLVLVCIPRKLCQCSPGLYAVNRSISAAFLQLLMTTENNTNSVDLF